MGERLGSLGLQGERMENRQISTTPVPISDGREGNTRGCGMANMWQSKTRMNGVDTAGNGLGELMECPAMDEMPTRLSAMELEWGW